MSQEKIGELREARTGDLAVGASPSPPLGVDIHFSGEGSQAGGAAFEFVAGRILFKASVAGREVWVLLDNRAERSLLDIRLAQAAKLDIYPPEGSLRTPLGVIPKRRVASVPIVIPGQLQMVAPALAAADLRPLFSVFEREVALVLGAELLGMLAVFVDIQAGRIQFGPGGSGRVTGRSVEIELKDVQPTVLVAIEGTQMPARIALGFEGTVRISPRAWTRIRPEERDLGSVSPALEGRVHLTGGARVAEFRMGEMRASDVPVQIAPIESEGVDVLIGLGVLMRTPFLIDVKARRLWVMPPRPRPAQIN